MLLPLFVIKIELVIFILSHFREETQRKILKHKNEKHIGKLIHGGITQISENEQYHILHR